jgi:nitrate/nitrite transporter NarK
MIHFVGCHRYFVIVLLCATLGINGSNFSALTCNQLDIAPKFAGTLMGITNSVGNIMGFLAPQISGAILNGHVSLSSKHFQFMHGSFCLFQRMPLNANPLMLG